MSSLVVFVNASDGVEVATHDFGGRGRPLVMAHAAGLHGLVFGPLAEQLGGDFRCTSFDGRAHGDTRLPPGHKLDWYGLAADVLAVVDGFGFDRPYGFGHSSGGTAVLMAEQARPGTFGAIYCFEPVIIPAEPPLGRDDASWLAAQARRRRATFPSREEALRHYSLKPPFEALAPDALRAYVDHGFGDAGEIGVQLKCSPENEATVYEMATAHDAYARLPEVTCPVMVACGAHTEGCTPDRACEHARRLPGGRSTIVAEVGHFGPLERPERVALSIRQFFSEVEEVSP